jgi:hypothetical protein
MYHAFRCIQSVTKLYGNLSYPRPNGFMTKSPTANLTDVCSHKITAAEKDCFR